jgi:hypothetical protein
VTEGAISLTALLAATDPVSGSGAVKSPEDHLDYQKQIGRPWSFWQASGSAVPGANDGATTVNYWLSMLDPPDLWPRSDDVGLYLERGGCVIDMQYMKKLRARAAERWPEHQRALRRAARQAANNRLIEDKKRG